MRTRASDSDIARIYRQTSTLGRLVDEGKRDPEWVTGVLQAAIEHKEDGRVDFVRDMKVIDLGVFGIDYETPLVELANGIKSFNPYYELFEAQPKPMHWKGGRWGAELSLVNYTFHQDYAPYGGAPLFDDVRSLLTREGFVSVQIRELIAVLQNSKPGKLGGIKSIVALGCGVQIAGRIGETPCVFEHVPAAKRFLSGDDLELRTEHTTHGYANSEDHFLVCKIKSSQPSGDF